MAAFPFAQQETWDDATLGGFDTEIDASSILDFPDYRELARAGMAPWAGAHVLRLRLSGTATGYIEEASGFDAAASVVAHVWFPLCIGSDVTLTDGDSILLFSLISEVGNVSRISVGLRRNGSAYELWAGRTGALGAATRTIERNSHRWYQVELSYLVSSTLAAADGTIDFRVDGGLVSAITGLAQSAITSAVLGAYSGTAAGNAGTILIGGIIGDEGRIFPRDRFPADTTWITRDLTAFIGEGSLDAVSLTGTDTNAVLTLFDTDVYAASGITFSREPIVYIRNVTASDQAPGFQAPLRFKKGCYVQLTGTNPQAWLSLAPGSSVVRSSGNYVDRGQKG